MVADQGWTVVGKGRASGSRKTKHVSSAIPSTVEDPAASTPAAHCGAEVGWVDGSSRGNNNSSGRRCRRRQAGQPPTPQERLERLQTLVQDCRREVLDSPFYARFQSVLAAAPLTTLPCGPTPAHDASAMSVDGADGGDACTLPPPAAAAAAAAAAAQRALGAQLSAAASAVPPADPPSTSPAAASPAAARDASASLSAALACVGELVIYGLGSPEDSRVSRYQLALALLLVERHLPFLPLRILAFDPAFSELDCRLLEALGVDVLTHNEGGARRVSGADGGGATLFYMPHCEGALCDSLLGANWCAQSLPRVIILGNSFESYRKRWSMRGAGNTTTATRPHRLLQLVEAGVVQELPTPDCGFHSASAFNDMSLHIFPPAACQRLFSSI